MKPFRHPLWPAELPLQAQVLIIRYPTPKGHCAKSIATVLRGHFIETVLANSHSVIIYLPLVLIKRFARIAQLREVLARGEIHY
jgi:hypothetical protein